MHSVTRQNAEVADDASVPLVPIPLMPSHPTEVRGKSDTFGNPCYEFIVWKLILLLIVSYYCLQNAEHASTAQPDIANATDAPVIATTSASSPNGESSEEEQDEGCMSIGRSPESREAVAAAIQKLGVQLLQNLETTPEQPNVIISPFSISLALSQLALGIVCMSRCCFYMTHRT